MAAAPLPALLALIALLGRLLGFGFEDFLEHALTQLLAQDATLLAELSANLGEAMVGINADEIKTIMEERGQ